MSLEAAIAENTAAVKELVEQLKASNAGREAALAKLTATAADGDTPKTTRTRAKKDDAPAAAAAPAEPATPKVPTREDVRALAEQFLDIEKYPKGTDARKERMAFVKSIIEHFGANPADPGLMGAIPDEHIPWAFEALTIKTGNMASPVSFPAKEEPAAAEDDDEDDLGI